MCVGGGGFGVAVMLTEHISEGELVRAAMWRGIVVAEVRRI